MFIKAGRVSDVNWSCLDELLINVNLNSLGVFQKSSHSIPSMFARVHSGALFNSIDAFNLARTTATLCERCLITTESSPPCFLPVRYPSSLPAPPWTRTMPRECPRVRGRRTGLPPCIAWLPMLAHLPIITHTTLPTIIMLLHDSS